MDVLLGPAHFRHVDQAFHTGLQLHKCTIIRNVGDGTLKLGPQRILGINALPGVVLQLLHAKTDALRFRIDTDNLHLHGVANIDDL